MGSRHRHAYASISVAIQLMYSAVYILLVFVIFVDHNSLKLIKSVKKNKIILTMNCCMIV